MPYDPRIHHRRSFRLQGYDYGAAGYYFVTICTHQRELVLDRRDVAAMVADTWRSLARRFPGVSLDEFIIMPNHVHGIVALSGWSAELGGIVRAFKSISAIAANRQLGRSKRPFWQRNYYERVIRNDRELDAVREYIRDNPLKWELDPMNPERRSVA